MKYKISITHYFDGVIPCLSFIETDSTPQLKFARFYLTTTSCNPYFTQMNKIRNAYILCGGKSSRMGRDKSGLDFEGSTLLNRIIDRASLHFSSVTLLSNDKYAHSSHRQIPDAFADAGPLGGLLAALLDSSEETIAIVPVDLPLISDKTLVRISTEPDTHPDALVAGSSERIQPLLGIYRTRTAPLLDNYLKAGKRSVMGFLDLINHQTFEVGEHEITNINTPGQYQSMLKRTDI